MAAAYRSSNSAVTSVSTSLTVTKPSGTVQNDILLAFLINAANTSMSSQAGWTNLDNPSNGASRSGSSFWKLAGGSEPSNYTFTMGTSANAACIVAYQNVNTVSPIDGHAGSTSASSPGVAPSIITSLDRTLQVCAFLNAGSGAWGTPAGFTEQRDADGVAIDDLIKSPAGSTGTTSATVGVAQVITFTIGLAEVPGLTPQHTTYMQAVQRAATR